MKLVLALVLALGLILSMVTTVAANDPSFTIEWDGDAECGVVYSVEGSIESVGAYTEFETSGADIYGDFDAWVNDCGEQTSYFDASVDQGDLTSSVTGVIEYTTIATGTGCAQVLALKATSDCEAEMEVDLWKTECGEIEADFYTAAEGCDGSVSMLALAYNDLEDDCDPIAVLDIQAAGEQGFDAELYGDMDADWDDVAVDVDVWSADGHGVLYIFAAGPAVDFEDGLISLDSGSLLVVADYVNGIDADHIDVEVDWD